jgi:hypothetical protein
MNEGTEKKSPECSSELEKKLAEMKKERELQDSKLWTQVSEPLPINKIKKNTK